MNKSSSRTTYHSLVYPFSLNGIRKRSKTIIKFFFFTLGIVGIGVAAVLFYVWQRVEVVRMEYRIDLLQKEREELLRTNQALYGEVLRLQALKRIESIAREKLEMFPPGSGQVIFMEYPPGVKHD